MNQTIGALIRLPFTGDTRSVRIGLASLNAMMEAIPESFELFKTRLNSYWSGDIATVKTRFSEYTKGDDNWKSYVDGQKATELQQATKQHLEWLIWLDK